MRKSYERHPCYTWKQWKKDKLQTAVIKGNDHIKVI